MCIGCHLESVKRVENDGNHVNFHVRLTLFQVQAVDFPHLLVYGPSGCGKKTRIMCVLRELYGSGVEKLRIQQQSFQTPSNKKVEISTIASNYHIEVNPRFV